MVNEALTAYALVFGRAELQENHVTVESQMGGYR
jgi:hypothetical protein